MLINLRISPISNTKFFKKWFYKNIFYGKISIIIFSQLIRRLGNAPYNLHSLIGILGWDDVVIIFVNRISQQVLIPVDAFIVNDRKSGVVAT
jgi:hypothetical protein